MDSTKHKMTQTTKKTTGLSLFKTERIVINCLENLLYIVNVAAVRCCKQQEPDSLQSCLGHWSPPATASTASFCVSDVATLRSLLNTENCYLQPHMKRGRWSPELPGTEWPAFHLKTDDCPPMSASVGENTVHIMQFTCHGHITFPTPKLYYFLRDLIKKTLVVCQFDSDCSHRGKAEHYGSFQWTHKEPFSSRKANFLLFTASVCVRNSIGLHAALFCWCSVPRRGRKRARCHSGEMVSTGLRCSLSHCWMFSWTHAATHSWRDRKQQQEYDRDLFKQSMWNELVHTSAGGDT